MATVGRHSEREPGTLVTWIPRVIATYVSLVLIIGGLTLGWILMGSGSGDTPPKVPPVISIPKGASSTDSGPSNDLTRSTEDPSGLVANAKRIKPLENIEKGDRVIFRGQVCVWQLWNGNLNTSTIKCPGRNRFQTQTGRLTPVELKP
ncbi:MAG TPA: hypothetical protein VLL08_20975 [Kineosporiaceae bacterium]|nr:hypothetical protein [Kineosporiaceae bacterium]